MTTITLQDAQSKLPELIHQMQSGEELVITENEQPIARLVALPERTDRPLRRPGTLRGTVLHTAADFDAPLEDFQEYMRP